MLSANHLSLSLSSCVYVWEQGMRSSLGARSECVVLVSFGSSFLDSWLGVSVILGDPMCQNVIGVTISLQNCLLLSHLRAGGLAADSSKAGVGEPGRASFQFHAWYVALPLHHHVLHHRSSLYYCPVCLAFLQSQESLWFYCLTSQLCCSLPLPPSPGNSYCFALDLLPSRICRNFEFPDSSLPISYCYRFMTCWFLYLHSLGPRKGREHVVNLPSLSRNYPRDYKFHINNPLGSK